MKRRTSLGWVCSSTLEKEDVCTFQKEVFWWCNTSLGPHIKQKMFSQEMGRNQMLNKSLHEFWLTYKYWKTPISNHLIFPIFPILQTYHNYQLNTFHVKIFQVNIKKYSDRCLTPVFLFMLASNKNNVKIKKQFIDLPLLRRFPSRCGDFPSEGQIKVLFIFSNQPQHNLFSFSQLYLIVRVFLL